MKLLWFTWKDLKNPLSGGAEVVNEEIAKRFAADGHEVIFVVAGFPGGKKEEIINGYKIIRVGNKFSVYWHAYRYYKNNLEGWADVIVEEINTAPFFTPFYAKEKKYLLYHQLCREIWFYQMGFPASLIGYLLEPLYLYLLRKNRVLTISNSTKKDLLNYGYSAKNINIFSVGIENKPIRSIDESAKFTDPTILSLGSIRPMKRPLDQIKAFEIAKDSIPKLKMKIAGGGSGRYFRKVMDYTQGSRYKEDIEYLGFLNGEQKIQLMQKSHLILVTSVKEGWGLIVTEANSQGTPAIVYNVDGLRDSVKNGATGLVCDLNTPQGLSDKVTEVLQDKKFYDKLRTDAWVWSKEITFDQSYSDFIKNIT